MKKHLLCLLQWMYEKKIIISRVIGVYEMSEQFTIVVSSCDAYKDLWTPFFTILKSEWIGIEHIPIVLNTESLSYAYDGLNIRTLQLYKYREKVSWTERLRETLKRISTDYVITLLDDFFMMDKVRSEDILTNIKWMDGNKKISVFSYMETFTPNIKDDVYRGFERRPLFGTYRFNCQAALWRRKHLIEYLDHDESPWEWELYGNWRSYRHPFRLFYSHIVGEPYVFPYIFNVSGVNFGGLGLFKGRWYLPYVEPLFIKHDIEMDYSVRGVITDEEISVMVKNEKEDNKPKRFRRIRRCYGNLKYIFLERKLILQHFF